MELGEGGEGPGLRLHGAGGSGCGWGPQVRALRAAEVHLGACLGAHPDSPPLAVTAQPPPPGLPVPPYFRAVS